MDSFHNIDPDISFIINNKVNYEKLIFELDSNNNIILDDVLKIMKLIGYSLSFSNLNLYIYCIKLLSNNYIKDLFSSLTKIEEYKNNEYLYYLRYNGTNPYNNTIKDFFNIILDNQVNPSDIKDTIIKINNSSFKF
jgi:hypothetical protein